MTKTRQNVYIFGYTYTAYILYQTSCAEGSLCF
jgi:hypothetical protein